MPGYSLPDSAHATLLLGTAALKCLAGVIGGLVAGVRCDTLFLGAYIVSNAGPATLTITGLANSSGTAGSMVITGSTTADYFFDPPFPILNELAAFAFTPSVDSTIIVFTRAYTGP